MFSILHTDKNSRARAGVLLTAHGEVATPTYVVVGTHARVRMLEPADLPQTKTQLIIANTYHLWRVLGDGLQAFQGLHAAMGWPGPIMTDSGGFQVFSFGFGREHQVGKITFFPGEAAYTATLMPDKNLVRITDEGVWFKLDDESERFLGPRDSIRIQERLGADIIVAFDECTSPLHDYAYTACSIRRTHAWAKECLASRTRTDQLVYGVVQGGEWRDLREESARYLSALPFDGYGIGGALGKSRADMLSVLDWTVPLLPENRPRHFLGMGTIEDILDGVARGIDQFDCVIPTREARHGGLWTRQGRFDIMKKSDMDGRPVADDCACPVCAGGVLRRDIRELFRARDPQAARLATLHNVFFFNDFMEKIRQAIFTGRFKEFSERVWIGLSS